jgi:hypothetical protein
MRELISKQGDVIKVSNEDFDWLSEFDWNVYDRYAESVIGGATVKMHRLILNANELSHVDHIDGDSLNNQRDNLRLCNRFQNQQNRKLNKNSTTGYKGVKLMPNGKFRARVQAFGKRYSLGCFDSAEDAAEARKNKAKELHNEFYRER